MQIVWTSFTKTGEITKSSETTKVRSIARKFTKAAQSTLLGMEGSELCELLGLGSVCVSDSHG